MGSLVFEQEDPILGCAVERADVACFIGFVDRIAAPSDALRGWFHAQGWDHPRLLLDPLPEPQRSDPNARFAAPYRDLEQLLEVPVPLDSWAQFTRYFSAGSAETPWLAAAVRSFFAQGGRRCYVVRVGGAFGADVDRETLRRRLVPEVVAPHDRAQWFGVWHLFGLPEVSFVSVPDLPALCAVSPPRPPTFEDRPQGMARFSPCAERRLDAPVATLTSTGRAPRCDEVGYTRWRAVLERGVEGLRRRLREVMWLASVPLPADTLTQAHTDMDEFLFGSRGAAPRSAFVQLTYPWVHTLHSGALPEALEPPEGPLAGLLARNALLRGTFRSACTLPLVGFVAVAPVLDRSQDSLLRRVSVFGPTQGGVKLRSDATPSADDAWRQASLSRLVGAVSRCARAIGDEVAFDPSEESTWARIEARLRVFLRGVWAVGALRGRTESDAFSVRCDRTTMTQNDLDAGRLIVTVTLDPVQYIESIVINLRLRGEEVS